MNRQTIEPDLIEAKPPKNAGPYHNYGLRWFGRGKEAEFTKRHGYIRAYLWTDKDGERVLTLCEADKIKDE